MGGGFGEGDVDGFNAGECGGLEIGCEGEGVVLGADGGGEALGACGAEGKNRAEKAGCKETICAKGRRGMAKIHDGLV